ncbi:MAG: MTH1187 family thiamine-binding protein [Candidatus Bipolaricaulia bacterium]
MIVEFSITPIGRGESLSEEVARVLDLVDQSGLDYRLTPMGTILEGDWDEVFALIKRCHEAVLERANRVSTWVHIDDRKGAKGQIRYKVEAIERRLGRTLKR